MLWRGVSNVLCCSCFVYSTPSLTTQYPPLLPACLQTAEYEFYQFRTPSAPTNTAENPSTAAYLRENPPHSLPSLTEGMFGYSLTRTVHNQDYFYDVFDTCEKFDCNIEGWHTESGPGVFEAALEFGEIRGMADRASLFK